MRKPSTCIKLSGHASARGFSLMDVAIAMTILGILIAGALAVYRVYLKARALEVTEINRTAVETALGTFVVRNKRFPVPMGFRLSEGDAGYGREGTMAGGCSYTPPSDSRVCRGAGQGGQVLVGSVPFLDLNLPAALTVDGYGRRFTYAVSEAMTQPDGNQPGLHHVCIRYQSMTAGVVSVEDCTAPDHPPEDIALISHGPDGVGAWTVQGRIHIPCGDGDKTQDENCDNDGIFINTPGRFEGNTEYFTDDEVTPDIRNDSNDWDEIPEGINNRPDQFVGIGVENPGKELDVDGNIKADKVRTPDLCKDAGSSETDCFDPDKIAGGGMRCQEAAFVKGIANSNVLCATFMPPFNCPGGQVIVGLNGDGSPQCQDPGP